MTRHTFILLIVAALILTSCGERLYHTAYQNLSHSQWDNRDTLLFDLPPSDHDFDLAITLAVRTTKPFAYRDIVTQLDLIRDGRTLSSTPITITINDYPEPELTGFLTRERHSTPYALHMEANHQYSIRVTHRMRLNPLDHIPTVGIIVE